MLDTKKISYNTVTASFTLENLANLYAISTILSIDIFRLHTLILATTNISVL